MKASLRTIVAVAVWACEPVAMSSRTADWSIRDSAGVTVVSNHPRSPLRGCITVDPDAETSIPANVERSGLLPPLFNVRGGAASSDGRIAILNAGSRELLYFAADGSLQNAVGGVGRGPGEFLDPTWLGHGAGGSLVVWDTRLMRLSTFDWAGRLVESHQVGIDGGEALPPAVSGWFEDGSFFTRPGPLAFFPSETGVTRLPEAYGRHDTETGLYNRLASGLSWEMAISQGQRYSLPFGKTSVAVAHLGALLVGDNGSPTIRYYDMNGRLRRVVEWVSEPISVTARDRAAYLEHIATVLPRFAPPSNARFARERPRFLSIQGDRTGWIWVQMFAGAWEPPAPWWVFDENGVLQCEVEAPQWLTVLEIGEAYLLALLRDDDGEESVVRFRLVRHTRHTEVR